MPDYTLYSYFRSSCSARLRIALNLKNLTYDLVPVNLLKSEHLSDAHRALNPSATVPLLICHKAPSSDNGSPLRITQSLAALEYLHEAHPASGPPLLPTDPGRRAAVRSLCDIIACDTQPVTNLHVIRRLRGFYQGGDGDGGGNGPGVKVDVDLWMREHMAEGLAAYETVAVAWAGSYSVGDDLSMADCCLVPAVWNAMRFGVDLGPYPTVRRVMGHLEALEAVERAGYFVQPDTPEELRKR